MNTEATKIIEALGDTAEVARLFDIKMPSVSGWKELGIPKGSPIDASHKNGTIVKEHRKENRARGGALKK